MSYLNIPSEVKKKVDREVDPNEKIKWIAQPIPKSFFTTKIGYKHFLFSTVLLYTLLTGTCFGFILSIYIFLVVPKEIEFFNIAFVLFHLILLATTLPIISSYPLWERRRSRNTVYLITNQRAIVIEGGVPRSIFRLPYIVFRFFYMYVPDKNKLILQDNGVETIKSFSPQDLVNVYRREKQKGLGDVIFQFQEETNSTKKTVIYEMGFFAIRNPKKVEEMVKELANNKY